MPVRRRYLSKKIKGIAENLVNYTSHIFLTISGILIVLMVLSSTYGVIRRYMFNNPEPYSYEITIIFLIWCFVFGVAELERKEQHIRVDIISSHLPKNIQNILTSIVTPIAGLFISSLFTWKGWVNAWYSLQISEVSSSVWEVPLFPVKIIIPICFGVLSIVLLMRLYHGIVSLSKLSQK
jgi:TRAP-type C4-dicarboxylate transport system permease small subunit